MIDNIKKPFLEPGWSELGHKEEKERPCQSLFRSWLYLSPHIPLDLTFLAGILSRFVESPATTCWVDMKRVPRYLQGAHETRITIGAATSESKMQNRISKRLSVYRDCDWTRDIATMKSTGGFMIQMNGRLVSWLFLNNVVYLRQSLRPVCYAAAVRREGTIFSS